MGAFASLDIASIQNQSAREFVGFLIEFSSKFDKKLQRDTNMKKLVSQIYQTMKQIPENNKEIPFSISGPRFGPLFFGTFARTMPIPPYITQFSITKSNLTDNDVTDIVNFIKNLGTLNTIDLSRNSFPQRGKSIIFAAAAHPALRNLYLDQCGITEQAVPALLALIKYNDHIQNLNVTIEEISRMNHLSLVEALLTSHTLMNVDINPVLKNALQSVHVRNSFISSLISDAKATPFQRTFRQNQKTYKSVKGRDMILNRGAMREAESNTAIGEIMRSADERATSTIVEHELVQSMKYRVGMTEMRGRRETMEDVSKVMDVANGAFFAIFDGHGGREAAEYAAEHIPTTFGSNVTAESNVEDAFVKAFHETMQHMKPFCVYVGTTAVISYIRDNTLYVANAGDSRCILCRGGKAIRMTVDHKPELPEETQYIKDHGGCVIDMRVGGMLAVSRALGDAFLGDAINSTPYTSVTQLQEDDTFMILACDGVWDVMSDQDAVDIVVADVNPLTAAIKIRDTAFEKGSMDNISVVVVSLMSEE